MFSFSLWHDSARSARESQSAGSAFHQPPASQNSTVAFAQNVSDLTKNSGSLTMQVNLTNAPPIIGFRTIFTYNTTVLKGTGLDYSNSILGSNPTVTSDCIDALSVSNPATACPPGDAPSMVDVQLGTASSQPIAQSGPLFRISFNVLRVGLSPFHFTLVALLNGSFTNPSVRSFDGYFSNKQCGTLNNSPFVCQPAIADFTVSPPAPRVGAVAVFNATASRSPNPGAKIASYSWDWGEPALRTTVTTNATSTQSFAFPSPHQVTLTVTDTDGITGLKTVLVNVTQIIIDLAVGDLRVDRSQGVYPGQSVTITAYVQNSGTRPQNATLTICVEAALPTSLPPNSYPNCVALAFFSSVPALQFTNAKANYSNLAPNSGSKPLQVVWNTTGFTPRVYKIDAIVDPARAPNGTIIEPGSAFLNNVLSAYVQIVIPLPLIFFGLGLLQTAGIGVLLVAVLATARVLLKRKSEIEVGPLVG